MNFLFTKLSTKLSTLVASSAIILLATSDSLTAQSTLANFGWEQWTAATSGKYDEPSGGVWATPNPALDVAFGSNPAPVAKESGAGNVQNGTYSAKLKTVKIFGVKSAGTVFTGKFVFNLSNPTKSAKLGVPFTARPDRFTGWYKYTGVNGDSCLAYAKLTKFNAATGLSEQVGLARMINKTGVAVTAWTQFDIPFDYSNTNTPDSITVVITSSAGAENLQAPQEGSTMYSDNNDLLLPTGVAMSLNNMVTVRTFPNPATSKLTVELGRNLQAASIRFFTYDGKLVTTKPLIDNTLTNEIDISSLNSGMYYYDIQQSDMQVIGAGKIEVR